MDHTLTRLARLRSRWTLPSLAAMRQARRNRDALRNLSPHLLDDIGVTAAEAEAEAARPLWDVPGHWQR